MLWTGDPLALASRVLRTWVSGREVYSWDATSRTATWAKRY